MNGATETNGSSERLCAGERSKQPWSQPSLSSVLWLIMANLYYSAKETSLKAAALAMATEAEMRF